MNINAAFPSQYLKAADLDGQPQDVTITKVEMEPVGREKQMKAVVYFEGWDKGVVLNKTNATAISKIASTWETDEWAGVTVTLFPTFVEFGGEQTEAIRIRAPKKGKVAAAKVVSDEKVPF